MRELSQSTGTPCGACFKEAMALWIGSGGASGHAAGLGELSSPSPALGGGKDHLAVPFFVTPEKGTTRRRRPPSTPANQYICSKCGHCDILFRGPTKTTNKRRRKGVAMETDDPEQV